MQVVKLCAMHARDACRAAARGRRERGHGRRQSVRAHRLEPFDRPRRGHVGMSEARCDERVHAARAGATLRQVARDGEGRVASARALSEARRLPRRPSGGLYMEAMEMAFYIWRRGGCRAGRPDVAARKGWAARAWSRCSNSTGGPISWTPSLRQISRREVRGGVEASLDAGSTLTLSEPAKPQ